MKKTAMALALSTAFLAACGGSNSSNNNNGGEEPPVGGGNGSPPATDTFTQVCLATPSSAGDADVSCASGATTATDFDGESIAVPEYYGFITQIDSDSSCSVSYTGQTARNVAMSDMKTLVACVDLPQSDVAEQLTAAFVGIDDGEGSVNYDLMQHNQVSVDGKATVPGTTFADISGDKSLVGKIAGNDKCTGVNATLIGQSEGLNDTLNDNFTGSDCTLSDTSKGYAQQLVEYYIDQVEALSAQADTITVEGGVVSLPHYVDAEGRDYQQLMQKFLSVAVAFNQGTNDYLSTDFTKDGVHQADKGTKPYSTAEHKWDEAFGYFGAARDYAAYTDAQIKAGTLIDTNNDTYADLRSEVNMNHSVNCAKRDAGLVGKVDSSDYTDYTTEAMNAFLEGRAILNHLAGAQADLDAGSMTQVDFDALETKLVAELDDRIKTASVVWEKCIAATAVHYINDSIDDIDAVLAGTSGNKFADVDAFTTYAKHWSELKGFALGLQYNPLSPIYEDDNAADSDTLYSDAMDLIGDAPLVSGDASAFTDYKTDLESARSKLADIYGFTADQAANW